MKGLTAKVNTTAKQWFYRIKQGRPKTKKSTEPKKANNLNFCKNLSETLFQLSLAKPTKNDDAAVQTLTTQQPFREAAENYLSVFPDKTFSQQTLPTATSGIAMLSRLASDYS